MEGRGIGGVAAAHSRDFASALQLEANGGRDARGK